MDNDPLTALAYWMFVNHGWEPSRVINLPRNEIALMLQFARKESKAREKKPR